MGDYYYLDVLKQKKENLLIGQFLSALEESVLEMEKKNSYQAEQAAMELQNLKRDIGFYNSDKREKERYYNEAKKRVNDRGYEMGWFQGTFRNHNNLPDMTYEDALTLVLETLNWQGVPA